jgi:hypothetical protein
MKVHHTVQQCRWSEATLFLEPPLWLDFASYPWSCRSTGAYHPIADARICRTCERWTSRLRPERCACTEDPD